MDVLFWANPSFFAVAMTPALPISSSDRLVCAIAFPFLHLGGSDCQIAYDIRVLSSSSYHKMSKLGCSGLHGYFNIVT